LYKIQILILLYIIQYSMNTKITKTFFGKDADFFIGKSIIIKDVTKLDRERSAVKVTFEEQSINQEIESSEFKEQSINQETYKMKLECKYD